jgi:hypothetical protein
MVWSADGVQINFSGTGNSLVCTSGSIKSFAFSGAKGKFTLAMSGPGATTTWNTQSNSTTTAQIDIEGGTFDLQGTGTITSSYGGQDVYVAPSATLKFDYADNVTVADLFDNGNDFNGYIVNDFNNTTGSAGTITTTPNKFDVTNKMPIRNKGSVTVDTGKLTFSNAVAGAGFTNGVSYYQPSSSASTTVLNGATLGAQSGFEQDAGKFTVGAGGANLAMGGASLKADFEGGSLNFPTGSDYETLTISTGNLVLNSTTVNMKINGTNTAQSDRIVASAGTITIGNTSVLNVTVNNGLITGRRWTLMNSRLGINDITGSFGTITPLNTFTQAIRNLLNQTYFTLDS